MIDKTRLPRHIAIIMDGNGRWAAQRHLPHVFGHRKGVESVDVVVECCAKLGIEALTLYAFSTENWKRPKSEVDAIMELLYTYLESRYKKLQKNKIRFNAIGRLDALPERIQSRIFDVMEKTSGNKKMIFSLAINYGGRQEITDAVKAIINDFKKGDISKDEVNESFFANYLYTKSLPEVDLLVRTSDEFRVSNFLLWQISYAEILIVKTLWPDFRQKDLYEALEEYQRRDRRFGGR
jgi:undecaprenyl diphosphate synthase